MKIQVNFTDGKRIYVDDVDSTSFKDGVIILTSSTKSNAYKRIFINSNAVKYWGESDYISESVFESAF